MRPVSFLLAASAAALLATSAVAVAQPLAGVPLIPREALFGNPEKVVGRISPDGKWLELDRAARRRAQRLGRRPPPTSARPSR